MCGLLVVGFLSLDNEDTVKLWTVGRWMRLGYWIPCSLSARSSQNGLVSLLKATAPVRWPCSYRHLCFQCLNDRFLWVKPCGSKDFLLLLFRKCCNILFLSHTLSTFINFFFLFMSPIKQSCLFPAMVLTNPVTIQVFWYVFRSKVSN